MLNGNRELRYQSIMTARPNCESSKKPAHSSRLREAASKHSSRPGSVVFLSGQDKRVLCRQLIAEPKGYKQCASGVEQCVLKRCSACGVMDGCCCIAEPQCAVVPSRGPRARQRGLSSGLSSGLSIGLSIGLSRWLSDTQRRNSQQFTDPWALGSRKRRLSPLLHCRAS